MLQQRTVPGNFYAKVLTLHFESYNVNYFHALQIALALGMDKEVFGRVWFASPHERKNMMKGLSPLRISDWCEELENGVNQFEHYNILTPDRCDQV